MADSPSFDFSVTRDGEVPLGTQLARRIKTLIDEGRLAAGDRLPSVRKLAEHAGVNVNTARAVYSRLEDQGVVSSEQGRGTFVRDAQSAHPARADLRREIERLEAELARRPQLPSAPDPEVFARKQGPAAAGGLLSAEELKQVRDSLLERLDEIDDARSEVIRTLERLDEAEHAEAAAEARGAPDATPARGGSRSASTLGPVRVRWVGGA